MRERQSRNGRERGRAGRRVGEAERVEAQQERQSRRGRAEALQSGRGRWTLFMVHLFAIGRFRADIVK